MIESVARFLRKLKDSKDIQSTIESSDVSREELFEHFMLQELTNRGQQKDEFDTNEELREWVLDS